MKLVLLNIINADSSYNKSATRYLYKTHPVIWANVINRTAFLPLTAKPKQRVWHILHGVTEVPRCPITNYELKWAEKAYLTTANRTAKQLLKHRNGDYANSHTAETNEKRRVGNLTAVENGRKYRNKDTYTADQYLKSKQTCLAKYGVENGSQSEIGRKNNSESQIKNGATPKHLRGDRSIYYALVIKFTKESWKLNFDDINPTRLNRSEIDLDHIYSIQQGFRDSIPPYIIGHWTNLRMLPKLDNYSKGMRCDKTKDQLFDDFFG